MNESKSLIKFNHGSPWPWCVQLDTTLPPSQRWKQRWLRTHREGNRSQSPAPDAHFVFCFLFVWLFFRSEKNGGGIIEDLGFHRFPRPENAEKILSTWDFPYHSPYQSCQPGPTKDHISFKSGSEKPWENLVGFRGRCSSSRASPEIPQNATISNAGPRIKEKTMSQSSRALRCSISSPFFFWCLHPWWRPLCLSFQLQAQLC